MAGQNNDELLERLLKELAGVISSTLYFLPLLEESFLYYPLFSVIKELEQNFK